MKKTSRLRHPYMITILMIVIAIQAIVIISYNQSTLPWDTEVRAGTSGSALFDFPGDIPVGPNSEGDEARIITDSGYALDGETDWSFTVVYKHLPGGLDDNHAIIAQQRGTGSSPNAILITPTAFGGRPYIKSLGDQSIFTAGPQTEENPEATQQAIDLRALTPFDARISAVKEVLEAVNKRARVFGTFVGGTTRTSTHYIKDDEWQRLAITYNHDEGILRFYANGQLVGQHGHRGETGKYLCPANDTKVQNYFLDQLDWDTTDYMVAPNEPYLSEVDCDVNPRNTNGSFVLGGHGANPIQFLNGHIAQFRAFTRTLSPEEIASWSSSNTSPDREELQIEYLFESDNDDLVIDTSGNENHGTMFGRVSWSGISPFEITRRPSRVSRIIRSLRQQQPTEIRWSMRLPESLSPEETIDLRWNINNPGFFYNLYYSPDEGESWTSIAMTIANINEYTWSVPTDFSGNNLIFKVEVTDLAVVMDSDITEPIRFTASPEKPAETRKSPILRFFTR